ncbi:CPBP family intramembrane metalloprotease [Methylobacterium organophilum]|uniref:CPBP family intramembrane glutamic endopeptidase n=1 Tax=Methylobacterium organophilum TaxID=410 RepID=UPI001F141031|nr:type II CAAX endopeptidase family protein [Methylobacterium organophilum]UMY17532.1 CPBP family intramembrane metalloprotease [Methylobacterium organophilum]
MKSDPRFPPFGDAAVAGMHPAGPAIGAAPSRLAWFGRIVLLVLQPVLYLVIATLSAILLVRVAGDLRLGINPLLPQAQRPLLPLAEVNARALAVDILRQLGLALMVVAAARWRDGPAWRARLGLARPAAARRGLKRLWLLFFLWPALHIAWVSGASEALHVPFARGVHLSPYMSRTMLVLWLAYVGLLAPLGEELLLRGATFARAGDVMRPAGAIVTTALLFCVAHVSELGFARPITLLPLALVLGWLRWRTGRLWPCILLHGWSNLALVAYLLWPAH